MKHTKNEHQNLVGKAAEKLPLETEKKIKLGWIAEKQAVEVGGGWNCTGL
jgi:hypothetical protein